MGHSIRSKVKRKHKTIKALKQDPIKAKTLQKLAAIGDQVLKEAIEQKMRQHKGKTREHHAIQ